MSALTQPSGPSQATRATASADSPAARAVIYGASLVVIVAVSLLVYVLPRTPTGPEPSTIASLNALLNGCAAVALSLGFYFIRRRRIEAHRRAMVTAFALSCAFLITYVIHHAQVGSVPFRGTGPIRTVYFLVLVPHIVLAAAVLPLALLSIYRGWTARYEQHRRVAKIAWPIWMYVSVSGVILYFMLYHLPT